jgi:hypothetical protein
LFLVFPGVAFSRRYIGGGSYRASGVTAAEATAALRGLVFEPLENRIIAERTEATTLIVSIDDGFVASRVTDGSTVVAARAVNDPREMGWEMGSDHGERLTIKDVC